MFKKKILNLHIFDGDGGDGGRAAGGGNGGQRSTGSTYTFEQAEEIATARAARAEQAALKSYFQQQGMSEEEVRSAIADYRQKKADQQPNISEVQKERDEARKENQQLKNSNILRDKGVKADDLDYVLFKVEKLVDDKTDFAKAADKFLKDNPKFTGTGNSYRMTTSSGTNSTGSAENMNDSINNAIRMAARR